MRPRATLSMRVSAAMGTFGEATWAAPEVDLVPSLRLGRGYAELQLGYAPLDNHTFLSDGRIVGLAAAGGICLLDGGALRLGGSLAVDSVAFHADPDVLTDHPGVDQLVRRGRTVAVAGIDASYALSAHLSLGLLARASLGRITLFDTPSGDHQDARLVLVGGFAEMRLATLP
jgi:hypothetical protein